jgi:hypothetical protein
VAVDPAEVSLLGALLIDPELIKADPPVVREPGMFSRTGQLLYRAIVDSNEKHDSVDAVLVMGEVANGEQAAVQALLVEAMQDCPLSANARSYVTLLERKSKRLEMRSLVAGLAEAVEKEDGAARVREHLEGIDAQLDPASTRKLQHLDLTAVMDEESVPVPWAVPGWLAKGDFAVIGGEPGTGKSVFALDLALALSTGTTFLGLRVQGMYRVLYLDEEMPPELAKRRLRMLIRGRELEPEQVSLRYFNGEQLKLDQADSRLALRRVFDEWPPDFIVLDSLIRFHSGNENDNSEMARFYAQMRSLQSDYEFGWVALHHLAKPGKDKSKELGHRLRGASDLRAVVDQLYGIEGDSATRVRTLTHDKNRWADTSLPMMLVYAETDDRSEATLSGESRTHDAEATIRCLLVDAKEDGVSRPTIVSALTAEGYKAAERLASSVLGKLVGQGTARKHKQGRRMHYWHKDHAPQHAMGFEENGPGQPGGMD